MRNLINQLVNHTLKTEQGRFSRMSIIIVSSWMLALYMAIYDFCVNGFRLDVWMTLVGIAVGTKLVDAHAKKVVKDEPKNEIL